MPSKYFDMDELPQSIYTPVDKSPSIPTGYLFNFLSPRLRDDIIKELPHNVVDEIKSYQEQLHDEIVKFIEVKVGNFFDYCQESVLSRRIETARLELEREIESMGGIGSHDNTNTANSSSSTANPTNAGSEILPDSTSTSVSASPSSFRGINNGTLKFLNSRSSSNSPSKQLNQPVVDKNGNPIKSSLKSSSSSPSPSSSVASSEVKRMKHVEFDLDNNEVSLFYDDSDESEEGEEEDEEQFDEEQQEGENLEYEEEGSSTDADEPPVIGVSNTTDNSVTNNTSIQHAAPHHIPDHEDSPSPRLLEWRSKDTKDSDIIKLPPLKPTNELDNKSKEVIGIGKENFNVKDSIATHNSVSNPPNNSITNSTTEAIPKPTTPLTHIPLHSPAPINVQKPSLISNLIPKPNTPSEEDVEDLTEEEQLFDFDESLSNSTDPSPSEASAKNKPKPSGGFQTRNTSKYLVDDSLPSSPTESNTPTSRPRSPISASPYASSLPIAITFNRPPITNPTTTLQSTNTPPTTTSTTMQPILEIDGEILSPPIPKDIDPDKMSFSQRMMWEQYGLGSSSDILRDAMTE